MNISKNIGYKDYLTYTNSQKYNILIKREEEIERLNNIIKEVREYINWRLEEHQDMYKYQMEELLEILGGENNDNNNFIYINWN